MKINEALKQTDTVVLAFGRLNPPTIGHKKLWDKLSETAEKNHGVALLCLSKSRDNEKNPLSFKEKSFFIKKYIRELNIKNLYIEEEGLFEQNKTIYQILPEIYKNFKNIKNVIFICGSDRIDGFSSLQDYNGKPNKKGEIIYDFDVLSIQSSGERDSDNDDISTYASASLMREYVKEGDIDSFIKMTPDGGKNIDLAKKLFFAVEEGLNLDGE